MTLIAEFSSPRRQSGSYLPAICLALALVAPLTPLFMAPQAASKPAAPATPAAAPTDAGLRKQFQASIDAYESQVKHASAGVPASKSSDSPAAILAARHQVADRLRALRVGARRGDIFTPKVASMFRLLLAAAFASPEGHAIRVSLRNAELAAAPPLAINATYPAATPLQSMPPSLLKALPALPQNLEYRLTGTALILRDREADLILDWIPDAVPAIKPADGTL